MKRLLVAGVAVSLALGAAQRPALAQGALASVASPERCRPGSLEVGNEACSEGQPVRRVALLAGHPELERALRAALSPWKMRLVVVAAADLGATLPSAAVAARALAQQVSADALVWVSNGPDGAVLCVHQVRVDNVTARSIAEPPFDAALAAALALSVKTVLRASGLAPEPADARASPEPAPSAVPLSEGPALPDSKLEENKDAALAASPRDPIWQLALNGAARFAASEPAEASARYGLELRWFPGREALPAWPKMLWFGGGLEASTPWRFARPNFRGEYWDFAPGVASGVAARLGQHWLVGLSVRGGLHLLSLSGTLLDDGTEVKLSRLSPSLLVRPEMGLRLGDVSLLVQPAGGLFFRRQLYAVAELEVLETKHLWWMLGGAIALRLK